MNESNTNSDKWSERTRQVTVRLAIWNFAWVLTVMIAAFGPELIWDSNKLLSLLAIFLNVAVGVGMIIANMNQIKVQDEMMQKVQLEAMGISLGVAVVGGIAYSMLDATNVIPFDAEIGGLVALIGITYLIAVYINLRRYK